MKEREPPADAGCAPALDSAEAGTPSICRRAPRRPRPMPPGCREYGALRELASVARAVPGTSCALPYCTCGTCLAECRPETERAALP